MAPYHFQILHVLNTGLVGSQSLKVGWFVLFVTKREAKDYFGWFLIYMMLDFQSSTKWYALACNVTGG